MFDGTVDVAFFALEKRCKGKVIFFGSLGIDIIALVGVLTVKFVGIVLKMRKPIDFGSLIFAKHHFLVIRSVDLIIFSRGYGGI